MNQAQVVGRDGGEGKPRIGVHICHAESINNRHAREPNDAPSSARYTGIWDGLSSVALFQMPGIIHAPTCSCWVWGKLGMRSSITGIIAPCGTASRLRTRATSAANCLTERSITTTSFGWKRHHNVLHPGTLMGRNEINYLTIPYFCKNSRSLP